MTLVHQATTRMLEKTYGKIMAIFVSTVASAEYRSQDEILSRDRLRLSAGKRLEQDESGWDHVPHEAQYNTVRTFWLMRDQPALRARRKVRASLRLENGVTGNFFFFFFFFFESAFVTRCMYVVTKTRAGAVAARLVGVVQS